MRGWEVARCDASRTPSVERQWPHPESSGGDSFLIVYSSIVSSRFLWSATARFAPTDMQARFRMADSETTREGRPGNKHE